MNEHDDHNSDRLQARLANKRMTRRSFLAAAAVIGGATAAVPLTRKPFGDLMANIFQDPEHGTGQYTDNYGPDQVIYTVCQQCNTFCTVKAVVFPAGDTGPTSLVRKIAGNPFSPLTTQPFGAIPYHTNLTDATQGIGNLARDGRSLRGGRTCLKGQAGIQVAYDGLRITEPLKRVGERGSGQWKTVTWEQATSEILDGASDLGTPGLRQIWAYVPEKQVTDDWEAVRAGKMSQAEFDARYRDKLIDTKHPDFGPKANQIAFLGGDRNELIFNRMVQKGLGSVNYSNHSGVCGAQGVTANARSHTGAVKQRMYADLDYVDYLMVWGTEPLTANRGPTWLAPRISNALQRGMKLVVVDPRMSRTAEKAHRWVPVLPGGDAALALGMARFIIEKQRFDARYLRAPGAAAGKAVGEPTWSDATHLVNVSDPKRPKLRMKDLGGQGDDFVVMRGGTPGGHSTVDPADLEVDTELMTPKGPVHAKSVFTLLKERVNEHTLAEYAEMSGVDAETISVLAQEFTSYGKRAVVMSSRGPAMHTNGYYNVRALNVLNFLVGNHDWKGGELSAGARYAELTGRYDLTKVPNPNAAWGIPLTREKTPYEKTSLFASDGYPAKRRWYPFGGNICYEMIPSAVDRYPYPIKALFIHRHSPVTSSPNGAEQAKGLADTAAIPLLVAFDVVVGESSQYADFLLPDVSYLERFAYEVIYPNQPYKVSTIGQPVTHVFDGPRPAEEVYIDLFKAMGLPGVGGKAFLEGGQLSKASDWYLKLAANVAHDGTPVPDATPDEISAFVAARQKALGPTWKVEEWQGAVKPEEWPKVVTVLNRGGRFEPPGTEYEGNWIKYRFGAQCNFYDEGAAGTKDSYTGRFFDGLPRVEPVRNVDGSVVEDRLPLQLINWKARQQGTHRTVSSAWLRELRGTNPLWMNPLDAEGLGVSHGDKVRITSATHAVEAVAFLTEGIRPGVVGTDFSYGHFRYGSQSVQIDGKPGATAPAYGHTQFSLSPLGKEKSGYAPGRGEGFLVNHVMRTDARLANTPLTDPLGGGASELDTWVKVEKV